MTGPGHSVRAATRRSAGFSLVELAVVLAVVGVLGAMLSQFLPRLKGLPAIAQLSSAPLERAEEALDGFILANGRLPCPATADTGLENCGANVGWLPVRTLGLHLSEPVRYGLYRAPDARDVDLGAPLNRFDPLLPPVLFPHYNQLPNPVAAPAAFPATPAHPVNRNGLDFCAALRNLAIRPGTALMAGGVPAAYALALAGAGDADGDGSPFDGMNVAPARFAPQGTARSATYDDVTRTVGAGQLFARIGCAARIGAVNGAARAAFAAYDTYRVAFMVQQFRDFQVTVRESNEKRAIVITILASADMANAIATSASAISVAAATSGVGAGAVVGAVGAIGAAAASLTAAALGVVNAQDALAKSRLQATAAANFSSAARQDYCAGIAGAPGCSAGAVARVLALDVKGLLP